MTADLLAVRSDLRQRRATFITLARATARACRPRVLIADDNLAYGRLLQAELQQVHGVEAVLAPDEGAVRMALARQTFDLIVVDGARANGSYEATPALYVSGLGADARVDVSKAEGIVRIAEEVARRVRG